MSELKTCPFCGSEAKCDVTNGIPQIWCSSDNCDIMMLDFDSPFLDELTIRWNTRADESSWKLTGNEIQIIKKFIAEVSSGNI